MTLVEFVSVVNAQVLGRDWWGSAGDVDLHWLALGQEGQHLSTILVDENERVWAVELFEDPEKTLVWVDPEIELDLPGARINHNQCLITARKILPDHHDLT